MDIDPNKIFRQFSQFCETDNIQNNLAPNAVLEWHGRTINSNRIDTFYRYSFPYKHKFKNIKFCDPIETRPSHFNTRKLPEENKDTSSYQNDYNSLEPISFINVNSNISLNNNLESEQFVKENTSSIYYDNVLEYELGLRLLEDVTPQRPTTNLMPVESKCQNYQQDTHEFSSQEHLYYDDSNTPNYSDLIYIEATGELYPRNNKSQYKTRKNHYNSYFDQFEDESPLNSKYHYNRKTRFKLSFRINKTDNSIQFALIIYEYLKPNLAVKRNLLEEFNNIDISDTGEDDDDSNVNQVVKESMRKATTKMLRF